MPKKLILILSSLLILLGGVIFLPALNRQIPFLCVVLQNCAQWERAYRNATQQGETIAQSVERIIETGDADRLRTALNTLANAISELKSIPEKAKFYSPFVESHLTRYQALQSVLQAQLDLQNLVEQIPSGSHASNLKQLISLRDQLKNQLDRVQKQTLIHKNDLLQRYQEPLSNLDDRIVILKAQTGLETFKQNLLSSKNPDEFSSHIQQVKNAIPPLKNIDSTSPSFAEAQTHLKSYQALQKDAEEFLPFWEAIVREQWDDARVTLAQLDQKSLFESKIKTLAATLPPPPTPRPDPIPDPTSAPSTPDETPASSTGGSHQSNPPAETPLPTSLF